MSAADNRIEPRKETAREAIARVIHRELNRWIDRPTRISSEIAQREKKARNVVATRALTIVVQVQAVAAPAVIVAEVSHVAVGGSEAVVVGVNECRSKRYVRATLRTKVR
jgi:hypothetical protein